MRAFVRRAGAAGQDGSERASGRASQAAPSRGPRRLWLHAVAYGLILCIFAADVVTPPDNVSICFAYTVPILLGVYTGPRSAFGLALATTASSLLGSFIRPPSGGIALSFVANRLIATAAQWLVAFLIEQRKRGRAIVQAHLAEERAKAETGQRFVRILSHEIASALTAIGGQSSRLAKLAPGIEPAEIVARTDKIGQAVARLDALVGRIQLAAEVDGGEIALVPEHTPCMEFLRPLLTEYEPGPELALTLLCGEETIYGDRGLLYQAVSNLVSNAVRYSHAPAAVTVSVDRSDLTDGPMITVSDCGIGIDADEVERVFEPYYRARNSTGIRGLGVGLHIVRHFVEAHGGEIRIASRPGQGTRVSLHLPPEKVAA